MRESLLALCREISQSMAVMESRLEPSATPCDDAAARS